MFHRYLVTGEYTGFLGFSGLKKIICKNPANPKILIILRILSPDSYFCGIAKIFTTEITSEQITSDNPIHQRLYKAYVVAKDYVKGDVLEVGCGEGRGVDILM